MVDTALIPTTVVYLVETDMSIRYGEDVENYAGLSVNVANPNFFGYRLVNSELVKAEVEVPETIGNPAEAILGEGNTSGMFTLDGGLDGSMSKVNAGIFIGEDNGPGKSLRELKEPFRCPGYAQGYVQDQGSFTVS